MSVLVIRSHSRFAVCRKAWLERDGARNSEALLIELSLEGARVSTPASGIAIGDTLRLMLTDAEPIEARVRWCGEGTIGLRFVQPLHIAALDTLIRLCRGKSGEGQALRA